MKKKENQFYVTDHACVMYYNANRTYSLNVQVDKAGSRGKEMLLIMLLVLEYEVNENSFTSCTKVNAQVRQVSSRRRGKQVSRCATYTKYTCINGLRKWTSSQSKEKTNGIWYAKHI